MDRENLLAGDKEFLWVIWKDACSDSARVHIDSVADCSLVTNSNLGFIIHENSERIILVHGVSTGGEIDYFAIPTNCVVERIYINDLGKDTAPDEKRATKKRGRKTVK